MSKIPFSVYDFFGYLAAGYLVIVAVDHVLAKELVLTDEISIPLGIFWLFFAYVIGHLLAHLSSWLIQHNLVGRWLKGPDINLFQDQPKKWRDRPWKMRFFPGYFKPLPNLIRDQVQEKAKAEGVNDIGEAIFFTAFGRVKKDEKAMSRLFTFLNMYGFCRNISFALLLVSILMLVAAIAEKSLNHLLWAGIAFIGAIGMLYRYLKFFRHYSVDLFITYREIASEDNENGS